MDFRNRDTYPFLASFIADIISFPQSFRIYTMRRDISFSPGWVLVQIGKMPLITPYYWTLRLFPDLQEHG